MPLSDESLLAPLRAAYADVPTGALAVAVSGGGDSTALLIATWQLRPDVRAVTVDHGLRPESGDEAREVAKRCASLGIDHTILTWTADHQNGNLQAMARQARQTLIADWARANGVGSVALGHTLDDQAETFIMRLARGSGVDGLAGMTPQTQISGIRWLRPWLGLSRADLRDFLTRQGQGWIDDPSNDNDRFLRVRVRQILPLLEEMGVSRQRIVNTSENMGRAREALEIATWQLAQECVETPPSGEVAITRAIFDAAPQELRLRLMAGILQWMSGAIYRPRLDSLKELLDSDQDRALCGCIIRSRSDKVFVRRELVAAQQSRLAHAGIWDARWHVDDPIDAGGTHVAVLGPDGLSQVGNWKEAGIRQEVLVCTPALWAGDQLLAAPLAGYGSDWQCAVEGMEKGLHKVLMTR